MSTDWPISIASAVVGFLVGMTGVGGGSVMTALLILFFGVHPLSAVGTDLLFASITKSVGTFVHARNETVDWQIVRRLAIGSVPATIVSLLLLWATPMHDPRIGKFVTIAIAVALLAAGVLLLRRARVARGDREPRDAASEALAQMAEPASVTVKTIVTGALLGFVVPITSVGAGAFGIAILAFLYPNRSPVRLVGSDIAHAVPLAFVAGLGHWAVGSINWTILASLLIGSVPGIIAGSHAVHRISERAILLLLGVLEIVIAIGLFMK